MGLSFEDLRRLTGGRPGRHDVACPICGPDRRAGANRTRKVLRIWRQSDDFITYACARCGASGHARSGVSGVSGSRARQPQATTPPARIEPDRSKAALAIWDAARPIYGTLAERYLTHTRGLTLDGREPFRFHPQCPFGPGELQPCLLAVMTDIVTDRPRAIHRTALTPDGTKLDRMMLGPAKNCAIKLDDDADVGFGLVICEGIETGLSARMLGFRPVWALASAGGIAAMPVLPGVDGLTILRETDDSGANARASEQCAQRWHEAGRDVVMVTPVFPGDLDDVRRAVA